MPGLLGNAVSAGTFPVTLSSKFTESRAVLTRLNEYHDGSSQRQALAVQPRRSWKLTKRLTASEMVLLRTFWEANAANAFYFYNPFQTDPPFSRTPTGTVGRYFVRFASDWDQTIGIVRSDAPCELIEVADDTSGSADDTSNPSPRVQAIMTRATLSVVWAYDGGSADPTPTWGGFGIVFGEFPGTWAKRTDSFSLLIPPSGYIFGNSYSIHFQSVENGTSDPPWLLSAYEVSVNVQYQDGTADVLIPSASAIQGNDNDPNYGLVSNPGLAVDRNFSTAATMTGNQLFFGRSNGELVFTF